MNGQVFIYLFVCMSADCLIQTLSNFPLNHFKKMLKKLGGIIFVLVNIQLDKIKLIQYLRTNALVENYVA